MNIDLAQLLMVLLGAGGLGGIAAKIAEVIRDKRTGELANEATAIGRWQEIADEARLEADRMADELRWYRQNYARLWVAYATLPPADKEAFPTIPPPPLPTQTKD